MWPFRSGTQDVLSETPGAWYPVCEEGKTTKNKTIAFLALFSLAAGVVIGLYAMGQWKSRDERTATVKPVEPPAPEPDVQEESAEADVHQAKPAANASRAAPDRGAVTMEITPAGTGKAFDAGDMELVRAGSSGEAPGPQDKKADIVDSLDPRLKEAMGKAGKFVDDFDEKTLEVTTEVLEEIPFLNLEPEKARLRPSGGGAELYIELSPEALGIKTGGGKDPAAKTRPDSSDKAESDF